MCKNKTWQHKRGMNKYKKIMYVAKYVHGNMAGTGPVCFFVDEEEPVALEGGGTTELETNPRENFTITQKAPRNPI